MFLSFVLIPSMKRQLQAFRQEACWASFPRGTMPRTCRPAAAMRRNAHLSTRFHSLRSQYRFSVARAGVQKKLSKRQKKRTRSSVSGAARRNRTSYRGRSKTTYHDSCDDIDDIFAAVGLWHLNTPKEINGCMQRSSVWDTAFCFEREVWWNENIVWMLLNSSS